MRHRLPLTGALLALALTACSPGGAPLIGKTPPPDPARARAAEVARAWAGSAAQEAWLHGYYPLDRQEWQQPDGLHPGLGALALPVGRFEVRAALPPYGPAPTATVVWADGSALALPVVESGELFRSLEGVTCRSDCRPLVVTAVRPGTRQVATSRGQATVPVWEFTVTGYTGEFAYPAVAAQEAARPPASEPPPLPGVTRADWTGTSPDGLTVHGRVQLGCGTLESAQTYETDSAVVLVPHLHSDLKPGQVCHPAAYLSPVDFRLSRPLGPRTVLDLLTGRPEAPLGPAGWPGAPQPPA
ncbi:hypothetical protein ABT095_28425 [Kitasatospora sp. NPDC002227]|uniref:hypothetical protein n=1 Tax=Kitasatospora sp. NPDC002227 TaxID=3154773 RepID=UPI00331B8F95